MTSNARNPEGSDTHPPAGDQALSQDPQARQAQTLWQRRYAPEAVNGAIARWAALVGEHPSPELSLKLARAYHLYGEMRARADAFEHGAQAAREAARAARNGEQRAHAAYWLLANRVAYASAAGYLEQVDQHQVLLRMSERLLRDSPHLDGGGPYRLLAGLLASPPLSELRDLARAKALYEAAISAYPQHLKNHIDYARHYAVEAQDLSTFRHSLGVVLSAPTAGPETKIAKRDARRLLELAPALFE